MSKRDRAAVASRETPRPPGHYEEHQVVDLEALQMPLLGVAGITLLVYLMRIAGIFGHPLEHLVGIGSWGVLMVCAVVRFARERRQGNFPARWGGLVMVVLIGLFSIGLIVEVAVATTPEHVENQPGGTF